MNHTLKIVSTFIIALSLNACNHDSAMDTKEKAEERNDAKFDSKASEADAQYIVDAYSAGMVEVNLSQRALDLAVTSDVKDLAQTMISAHQKMNAELERLAAQKQITIPHDLNDKQISNINSICSKKGRDFDVAYTDQLISDHKDAVSLFEKASENATDKDIRDYFTNGTPMIREHLDKASEIKDRLK